MALLEAVELRLIISPIDGAIGAAYDSAHQERFFSVDPSDRQMALMEAVHDSS